MEKLNATEKDLESTSTETQTEWLDLYLSSNCSINYKTILRTADARLKLARVSKEKRAKILLI